MPYMKHIQNMFQLTVIGKAFSQQQAKLIAKFGESEVPCGFLCTGGGEEGGGDAPHPCVGLGSTVQL